MSDVLVETPADGVVTLTLAAPERRNALTVDMAHRIIDACDSIDADDSVGAVIVQAQGPVFCAGAHRSLLARVAGDPASDANFTDLETIYQSFLRITRLLPPTIAAVRGTAVGAGLNLVLSTDLRVVAEDAELLSGFLPLGAHPGGGHFTLLARTAGREVAAGVGLFGQTLTGAECAARGLAWAAVPEPEVESVARGLAALVARNPKLARRAARSFRLEAGSPGMELDAAVQLEQTVQMWSLRNGPLAPDSAS